MHVLNPFTVYLLIFITYNLIIYYDYFRRHTTYAMELLWHKKQTPIFSGYIADIRRIMHSGVSFMVI